MCNWDFTDEVCVVFVLTEQVFMCSFTDELEAARRVSFVPHRAFRARDATDPVIQ